MRRRRRIKYLTSSCKALDFESLSLNVLQRKGLKMMETSKCLVQKKNRNNSSANKYDKIKNILHSIFFESTPFKILVQENLKMRMLNMDN